MAFNIFALGSRTRSAAWTGWINPLLNSRKKRGCCRWCCCCCSPGSTSSSSAQARPPLAWGVRREKKEEREKEGRRNKSRSGMQHGKGLRGQNFSPSFVEIKQQEISGRRCIYLVYIYIYAQYINVQDSERSKCLAVPTNIYCIADCWKKIAASTDTFCWGWFLNSFPLELCLPHSFASKSLKWAYTRFPPCYCSFKKAKTFCNVISPFCLFPSVIFLNFFLSFSPSPDEFMQVFFRHTFTGSWSFKRKKEKLRQVWTKERERFCCGVVFGSGEGNRELKQEVVKLSSSLFLRRWLAGLYLDELVALFSASRANDLRTAVAFIVFNCCFIFVSAQGNFCPVFILNAF